MLGGFLGDLTYPRSQPIDLSILCLLSISGVLEHAAMVCKDALQDAELVLVDLFTLIPLQHLAQVHLLALIHVVLFLGEYPVHVLVLLPKIIQLGVLSPANFVLPLELAFTCIRIDYVFELVFEKEMIIFVQNKISHGSGALDDVEKVRDVEVVAEFLDPLIQEVIDPT